MTGSILAFKISCKTLEKNQKSDQEQQLEALKTDIKNELAQHRQEYLDGINDVRNSITDMKASYQQTAATIELRIEQLEKKQDKHNSVIERTYELEKVTSVLDDKVKSAHHRLDSLERKSEEK